MNNNNKTRWFTHTTCTNTFYQKNKELYMAFKLF